jgi:DNA-binding IclR family transcriptional regulator
MSSERTTARDRPPEEAAEDTSFARGLRVFLTIADRGQIRADELSTLLETPLSTIYRYLRTLTEFGFVDRHDGGYRLGPRLLIGGGATVSSEELIRRADPILAMLVEETGETAVICRRVGLAAVCLHQQQSAHPLRVALEPGVASPLDRGAIARLLLAFAPTDVQDEILGDAVPGAVRRELEGIVAAGIARDEGEVISDTVTIAVPVMRDDGIVAAIAVIAPAHRATLAWRTRSARVLADAAAAVAGALRPAGDAAGMSA